MHKCPFTMAEWSGRVLEREFQGSVSGWPTKFFLEEGTSSLWCKPFIIHQIRPTDFGNHTHSVQRALFDTAKRAAL